MVEGEDFGIGYHHGSAATFFDGDGLWDLDQNLASAFLKLYQRCRWLGPLLARVPLQPDLRSLLP